MESETKKKPYLAPLVSVIEIEMEDVIAASSDPGDDMGTHPGNPVGDSADTSASYRTVFPGQ